MKPVYQFIDYRKFLDYYYQEKKKHTRHFSYRFFAAKAGINSPSFLKRVIDGKRNLTSKAIEKFAKALKLNYKESVYFRNLVLFNQAKTAREKQEYYAVLRSMSGGIKETVLRHGQYDYFDKWYTPIIRELICLWDFKDDYALISRSVHPSITPSEAKKAVRLLHDLGLVTRGEDGRYHQTKKSVTVDDSIVIMAVRSYAETMLEHAKQALHGTEKTDRHISTITLGISRPVYDTIVAEIDAFKDRIKAIVSSDEDSSQVYQFNLQLFPSSVNVNTMEVGKEGAS
jgi:uncharacterized protein (TIGR02147 family)